MDEFIDRIQKKWDEFKNYCRGIAQDLQENRQPRAVGKIILPLVPVAIMGGVLVLIWKNREVIMSGLVVMVVLYSIIGYCLDSRAQRKRAETERLELARQEAIHEKASTYESTYQKVGKVIWDVARELGPSGIVPPNRLGDIYSPGRIIPKMGGEVLLGLYLLQKSRDTVDTDTIASIMQTKVDQKFSAGDYLDIDEKYEGLAIVKVKDNIGFIEVYAALIDESYRRYKLNSDLNRDVPPPSIDTGDIEY